MKKIACLLCLAMLLSLFTACAANDKQPDNTDKTSTTTETAATDGEILKFALVGPLTGAGAQYGLAYQMACEYLVEKTNANGGINGAMVELEVYDDKQDPTETLNTANLLVEDKDLLGVVGSQTSGCSMAAAPVYEEAGIPMISPNGSHKDLPLMGDYIFSMTLPVTYEPLRIVDEYVQYLGYNKIGMLYSNDDWGLSQYDATVQRCDELGATLTAAETYISGTTKDFTPMLSKIMQSNPECIYLCCQYSDAILAVQQLDTLGNTIPIVSCSTIMKQEFLDAVGDLANGIYLENAFNLKSENPEYLELAEYCREKNGTEPDVYVTQAYDSLKVMLEAVEKFGPDRAAIKDYIYTLKDWQGVSGTITMSDVGTPMRDIYIVKVEDGKFVQVDGVILKSTGVVYE